MLATRVADVLDLLAVVIAGGLMLIIEAGRPGTPRILLALAFVFFVPGRAIVSNWPRLALWSEAAMAMIFSLAVLSLAATITLWAHQWHPLGLFEVEAAVSIAGLIAGTARRHVRGTGTRRVAS
jgi:hypothetical protein